MDRPSILKPALIGGAVFGFLGAVPLVSALNCACCALVMAGGFLAAYLYSVDCKKRGLEFSAGSGAKIGAVAGLIYAVVNAIIQGLIAILMPQDWDQVLEQMESSGVPPEMLDKIEQGIELMTGPIGPVIGIGVVLVLGLVFSTIGGLIGGAVFKVAASPPAPPSPSTYSEPGDSAPPD